MGEKIVVGPVNRGLRTDREPFVIDNDSFPTLINAYQWRGRIKRKRGTSLLTRLMRYFNSTISSYGSITSFNLAADAGNLLTGFSLQSDGNIVPGSVTLTVGANVYTDPGAAGTLVGAPGGSGTVNYATGAITITGGGVSAVTTVSFRYYPDLPVMGLEDLVLNINQFPGTLAFDTVYSYNIQTAFPYNSYDVSFFKNPAVDATNLPAYVPKTSWTAATWNSQDYQQTWTVNYQGALWATNGITEPFSTTNIGMPFKSITGVTIVTNGNGTTIPAVADLTIVAHGLVQGDFVFINEVEGITGINFQTGYVTSANPQAANSVRVTFPFAVLGGVYSANTGIAQYLTNRSSTTKDCIRWYDGDPTNGNALTPGFSEGKGWVNFCPPLSQDNYSIADLPAAKYYLVSARMIVPFKDRLLFIGPVVQTSAADSQVYLPDTVIYSLNGTPYYTASFNGSSSTALTSAATVFHSVLVPQSQTGFPPAFIEDSTGFGGFITAGVAQRINTVGVNEDVLIMGFDRLQSRFVYTGNDIVPFNFFFINAELGSGSTFSSIIMDKGVITKGGRGYILTSQVESARIDLSIPDQVFEVRLSDNGTERVTAWRDYINEWIFLTYPYKQVNYRFPNQTLQYNYRDDSWAIFNECYTTYGTFRKQTGFTWATVGAVYPSWSVWNDPWNAGVSNLLNPDVIAGNQQGFVMIRDDGTDEGSSLYIQSFSGNQITSPDHCLNNNDYIIIRDCIGTIGYEVNNKIFSVYNATDDTFRLKPSISSGTYSGGGTIERLSVPNIQTKQFPVSWGMSRKTRIGVQQYLLTTTAVSQITLLIFLSQNASSPYNTGGIIPDTSTTNNSLIYSTVLYTCPESTNLGLTAANTNLQMVTAQQQSQIWHRVNTSLIGDTVQLGFTLSDTQMRSLTESGTAFAITGATQADPCVLSCTGEFSTNTLIKITGVVGMTELNNKVFNVISSSPTTVTIGVDSSAFVAYVSGGSAQPVAPIDQTAEIEIHGMIIDASPSQLLA